MANRGGATDIARAESAEEVKQDLFQEYGVSWIGQFFIENILNSSIFDIDTHPDEVYDTTVNSEVLAGIALLEAYKREPEFKLFLYLGFIIGFYDLLHLLPVQVYGVLFVALATLNGLLSSLRSPKMLAAELESETDDKGMPADYRAKAIRSVRTNVTIVLLTFAFGIQVLISASVLPSELFTQNYATGTSLHPLITSGFLLGLLFIKGNSKLWGR